MLNQQLDKAEKIIKRLLKIQNKMEVDNPALVGLLGLFIGGKEKVRSPCLLSKNLYLA